MFRIILVYGSIAGGILVAALIAKTLFVEGVGSQLQGYLTMLIALSLVFVGVKRHRDQRLGGVIKFLPAFGLGIGIAGMAGLFYALSWEVSLHLTDFAFVDQYREMMIERYEAEGLTGDARVEKISQMDAMMEAYSNPLFRLAVSFFLEFLPVGIIVSLISALLLRNPKMFPATA
ncbi:MAG: DUF4199 domain-containing protein [Pseudomonadota bacterium]